MNYFCHETACVDAGARIGEGTKIWHFCHVMGGAELGAHCSLGQNCFVADGVRLGANVKVQNNVSIYTGTEIEDDVFLGPSCVLTNISNPRSQIVRRGLYERTLIRRGASIGANATVVCGTTIGRYAFVAAGAVVTRDVPDYAMIVGVPGKARGWVGRHGVPLPAPGSDMAIARMCSPEMHFGSQRCFCSSVPSSPMYGPTRRLCSQRKNPLSPCLAFSSRTICS